MTGKVAKLEERSFYEDDTPELPPPDVFAYNELRSCADLFRMVKDGVLEIKPDFQREVVWSNPAQTRFIDSLIKQLPIPSMCFSLDNSAQQWQVIDGLQRMATIVKFLSGEDWVLSKLEDIDPAISGQPLSKFIDKTSTLRSLYTRVENLTLPITVIRCDYNKPSHSEYLFTIFHRLNSGGVKLNNQEIRNCIYSGSFNNLLGELNGNSSWKKLNKMKQDTGYRFTKQELILRLFAFNAKYKKYGGFLGRFLNDYMRENRYLEEKKLEEKRSIFNRTVNIVYRDIYAGKIPARLSITLLEAVLVGVSLNLDFLEKQTSQKIRSMYTRLERDDEFTNDKLLEGLAKKERVVGRLSAAERIFAGK